jgi:hypothetical protein
MDVLDLLRALPGLLLIGMAPGLALLALIRPSLPWLWRLAAAPGLSIGAVGVLGLVYHRAHVSFRLATLLPPLAVLVLAAVAATALRRRRATQATSTSTADATPSLRTRPGRIVLAAALVAGLLSASVAVVAFRAHPLPPETDNPIHAYITQAIATQHDVMVTQPLPTLGSASVRERVAFEASAAEVAGLTGMRPEAAMLPLVLLCVLLLPLSLSILAFEATRNWVLAAVVPLLGIGFTMIPWALEYGEFPYLADATLIVPLALVARRALFGDERLRNLLIVAACVAAMWVTHGLEFFTALVVGVPFALASLKGQPLRRLATGAAGIAVAALAGAALITVLTPHIAIPTAVPPEGVSAGSQSVQMLARMGSRSQMLSALADFVRSELVVPALLLWILGVAAALLVRGMRWALAAHVLLLLMLADVGYGGILIRVWTAVFPWSGPDRVVSIQWFVVPLLMGWGIFNAPLVFRPILARARSLRAVQLTMGAVALVAVMVPVAATWSTLTGMQSSVGDSTHTRDADVAALSAMNRALPAGTLVLANTGADAGQWIDVLTGDVEWAPLVLTRNYVVTGTLRPAVDPKVAALGRACSDPRAARAALDGVGAVFVGSAPERTAPVHWDASCIAALPGVRELTHVSSGGRTAWVFAVDPTLKAQG